MPSSAKRQKSTSPAAEPEPSTSRLDKDEIESTGSKHGDKDPDGDDVAQVASDVDPENTEEPIASTSEATTTKYKGANDWQAVWSSESNAYYFWNSKTSETTWENPLTASASASAASTSDTVAPLSTSLVSNDSALYGGIDPDLAYLDPSLRQQATSATPAFQARFNSRTGRFQGDPSMNPDRVSEFKRGERQQEAFYDTAAWQESLGGKGLQRNGTTEGGKAKRASAKEVEQFKANKIAKKKRKLTEWLKD